MMMKNKNRKRKRSKKKNLKFRRGKAYLEQSFTLHVNGEIFSSSVGFFSLYVSGKGRKGNLSIYPFKFSLSISVRKKRELVKAGLGAAHRIYGCDF